MKLLIPEFLFVCHAPFAVHAPIEYFPLVKSADDGVIDSGPEFLRCCAELLEQSKRERFVIVKDFKIDVDGFKGLVELIQRLVDRELGLLESGRKLYFRCSHLVSLTGDLVRAAFVLDTRALPVHLIP